MSKRKVTLMVDRMEGAYAVCETPERCMINLPLSILPKGTAERACIEATFEINEYVSQGAQSEIEKLLSELMGE